MDLIFWIIFILSLLSLLYYGMIIIYAGVGTAFSDFWLVLGMAGIFISIFMKYLLIYEIEIAHPFYILFRVMAIVGSAIFTLVEVTLIYHSKQKAGPGINNMIILGAQIKGKDISKTLIKRLDTASRYMKENPGTVAVVSGGKGEKEALTEAEAMKQYLLLQGIKEKRIIKEDKSRNTFENILYSKPFLKSDSPVVIVTNGFHIFRSVQLAKKQGLVAQGLAAPTDGLLAVNYYVREAVGVLKDKILGNI